MMMPLDDDDHVNDTTPLDDDTFMSGTLILFPWYQGDKLSRMLLGKAFIIVNTRKKTDNGTVATE